MPDRPLRLRAVRAGVLVVALAVGGAGALPAVSAEQRTHTARPDAASTPPGPGQGLAKPQTADEDPGRPKGPKGPKGPKAGVPAVAFTCDPGKSHGQNVSAYVRSLPKGPGRGRQVSEVARSDCGKPPRR